jgi:hypothetical protein
MSRAATKTATLRKFGTAPKTTGVPKSEALPGLQSDFKLGERVTHPKFGNGVVRAIEADKLTIQFARNVTKQILDYYVKHRRR